MENIKGENKSEQFLIGIISYENNPGKRFIVQKSQFTYKNFGDS